MAERASLTTFSSELAPSLAAFPLTALNSSPQGAERDKCPLPGSAWVTVQLK